MFGLQPIHLIVILIVAVLIFGPSRLPELARALRKMIAEFRSAIQEVPQAREEEMKKPVSTEKKEPPKTE